MFTLQIFTSLANLVVLIFVFYYLISLRKKEKELEKKEERMSNAYRHIVTDALEKEKKILDNATKKADEIIKGAEYISSSYQKTVDQALQKIVTDIQKDALGTAKEFTTSYSTSLKQLTSSSLKEFEDVAKSVGVDLQKQVKDFHETVLPAMEKELADYKQARLKEIDEMTNRVIQKVAQEVLNKSISLEDHEDLLIESLDKAKKEGAFDGD